MQHILKILVAAAAVVLAGAQAPSPAQRVEYVLTPILTDGAMTAMQVDLRFRGQVDGETSLMLPDRWASQSELWRGVQQLEVVSGATMRDGDSPSGRTLTHRRGARIHVRYLLVQDFEGPPTAGDANPYRPVVQPTYFHFIGGAALAVPEVSGDDTVRVRATLPRGWTFASDLQHRGVKVADLNSSVLVGGDFRVLSEGSVRIAIRGEWSFADQTLAREAAEIVAGQRRFWSDEPEPYLVTVLSLAAPQEGWMSLGGTGLDDAFAFFATPGADAARITRTLAHEAMHTWIPGRIGGMPEQNEAVNYWLSEGFTDFYTGRILVREGLWTPAQFAEDMNEVLDAYAQSSERTAPNARIGTDFWNSGEVQRLPYQRGNLLAWTWDARLRGAGRDMDDVVLAMRGRARQGETRTAAIEFAEVMAEYGADVSADLATYVEQGAAVLLPEDTFGPCGRVTTREAPIFHRGFDIDATRANNSIITGVDRTLPAYAAGMRDGMVLVRRDGGEVGNAEREIGYVVRDGETERTLRYMPRGHGSYIVQRLELAPDLQGDALAQCVALIGGTA
jgi:predicted metalloprotease with PDZ domain